jgi:CRP-like cAMP-binding protein
VKAIGGTYDEVQSTVKSGDCFGVKFNDSMYVSSSYFCVKDVAISKQIPRSSTCVAGTTAELLVISRSVSAHQLCR